VRKKVLSPGDSTVVELVFNTRTGRSKATKTARVLSNDSTRASISIDFTCNIVPDTDSLTAITIAPRIVEFSAKSKKQTVQIQNRGQAGIELTMIGGIADEIEAKLKDKSVGGGKKGKLVMEWRGDRPEYDENHTLTVETGNKSLSRFSIPYVIKGEKGPQPGSQPKQGEVKKSPPPQAATQSSAAKKPEATGANKQVIIPSTQYTRPKTQVGNKPDTASVKSKPEENPMEGTAWPPE